MKLHLGYILGLFAIALAASAGYISVVGWGKLFAGESTIVMIVMGIIEAAKVITTIYLHRYGKRKPRTKDVGVFKYFYTGLLSLKSYLVIGVMSTMFLTSVGIYGFLTGAYQDTANKMEIHDGEVTILEGKKEIFEIKIEDNKGVINTKTNRITRLSDLRLKQETRLDSLLSNRHWSNVKKTQVQIEEANEEIQKLTSDIDIIVDNNSSLQDSVSRYQVKILELKGNSDVAAEIGPLKYIASLTGHPMGSIINWLVLVIIFIFDPMAISLVLASNKVFEVNKRKYDNNINTSELVIPKGSNIFVNENNSDLELSEEPTETLKDIWVGQDEDIIEPEPFGDINYEDEQSPITNDVNKPEGKTLESDKVITPEDQIKENKGKINDVVKGITSTTTPVIPTGNVKREEIKEIKEGTRGYSVSVPEPTKVGTNKEVRGDKPKTFFFRRPKWWGI